MAVVSKHSVHQHSELRVEYLYYEWCFLKCQDVLFVLSALSNLAEVYVEAIRSGRIPCLENAVETLTKVQNERAVEQGLQAYQSRVFELICFPLDPSELSDIHRKAEKAAIDVFISTSFNDTEQKAQLKLMVPYPTHAYINTHWK